MLSLLSPSASELRFWTNVKNLAEYVAQSMCEILPPLRSVRMTRDVWVNCCFISIVYENRFYMLVYETAREDTYWHPPLLL